MSGIPHRPAGKETPISKPKCPAEIPAVFVLFVDPTLPAGLPRG